MPFPYRFSTCCTDPNRIEYAFIVFCFSIPLCMQKDVLFPSHFKAILPVKILMKNVVKSKLSHVVTVLLIVAMAAVP
jgi:hypothetical protein